MKSFIAGIYPSFVSGRGGAALFFLRVVAGAAFMFHGWGKIHDPFGWMGAQSHTPGIMQALAAVSEFFGGLGWILGLLTPIASFGIWCTMLVAVGFHVSTGSPFVGQGGYEPALVYLVISTMLVLFGPGKISIDALIFGRARDPRS